MNALQRRELSASAGRRQQWLEVNQKKRDLFPTSVGVIIWNQGAFGGLEPDGDPDPDIPLLVGEDRFFVTDGHGFRAISVINHSPNLSGHG